MLEVTQPQSDGAQRAPGTRVAVDYRRFRADASSVMPAPDPAPATGAAGGDVSSGASTEASPQDTAMSRTVHPQLQTPVVNALVAIGANIQRARKSAFRMSRQRFAQALGCTAITLDRIERGDPGVAAVYYFAALEITRCLSRLVEITDPSALVVSMSPISWPDDAGGDFPDLAAAHGEPAAGGSTPPPAPAPTAAVEPMPSPAAPKPTANQEPAAKPSPEIKVTGYGPVISPPWGRR